jgi:hypothetical protein
MTRSWIIPFISVLLFAAGCGRAQPAMATDAQALATAGAATAHGWRPLSITRRALGDDVVETTLTLAVGPGPYDKLGLHRVVRETAPGVPAATLRALVLLHGDFATFDSNFAPSGAASAAAPYLARHGVDVWGIDRRWTFVPATATDLSGLAAQGFATAVADTQTAIALVRALRLATSGDRRAPALAGWSRGAQLAYAYAITDGRNGLHSIDGLAPLDIYWSLAPADADLQQQACARAQTEQQQLAAGAYGSDNSFQIALGTLDQTAPNDPSPLLPPLTNHQALLTVVTQSWLFAPLTDWYHFAAGSFDGAGNPAGLVYSSTADIDAWLAASPPEQALAELSDGDVVWCGKGSPIAGTLADVRQPLFYVGAAGGFGTTGLYSTTLASSRNVQTRIVSFTDDHTRDFGHADMLFSPTAEREVWQPLLAWLVR